MYDFKDDTLLEAIALAAFRKAARKKKITDEQIEDLLKKLAIHPTSGSRVRRAGKARKISRGQSVEGAMTYSFRGPVLIEIKEGDETILRGREKIDQFDLLQARP